MPKSNFQKIYPSAGGKTTLDGGLNDKWDSSEIEDNESPDLFNVIFDEGRVESRPGTIQLNTAAVATQACDGLYTRNAADGTASMCGWWGGELYVLSGTTFNVVSGSTDLFTSGNRVGAAEYEDYIFFGDGENIPMKYKDGDISRHGIYAPIATMTAATAATGAVLTGDYRYKVTYVNSNLVESDVGPATDTITVATQDITLSNIPTAPASFGVESRRLYRTETSGIVWKRLATISDNTTTTYDDGIADESLGVDAPTDQGVPPTYRSIIYHQGRLFCIDPADDFVKYSEVGNPFVFKVFSFRTDAGTKSSARIGNITSDIPQSLAVYDNSIVVLCKRSTWFIYTGSADDTTWQSVRVISPYGTKSAFAPFLYNNKLMFAATEGDNFIGFAALQGNTVDPEVTLLTRSTIGSDLKSSRLENEMAGVDSDNAPLITSIVHKRRAYVAVPHNDAAGNNINNRLYYFDFSYENLDRKNKFAWSRWSGLDAADFTEYKNDLYFADNNATGLVYKMNESERNDNGSSIDNYMWTKSFFGLPADQEWTKDWRWINVFFENTTFGTIKVYARVDSRIGDGTLIASIDLNFNGAFWGSNERASMYWGVSKWGQGDQSTEKKISLGTFRGKSIQFRFDTDNAVNVRMKITGIRLTYNLRGFR